MSALVASRVGEFRLFGVMTDWFGWNSVLNPPPTADVRVTFSIADVYAPVAFFRCDNAQPPVLTIKSSESIELRAM